MTTLMDHNVLLRKYPQQTIYETTMSLAQENCTVPLDWLAEINRANGNVFNQTDVPCNSIWPTISPLTANNISTATAANQSLVSSNYEEMKFYIKNPHDMLHPSEINSCKLIVLLISGCLLMSHLNSVSAHNYHSYVNILDWCDWQLCGDCHLVNARQISLTNRRLSGITSHRRLASTVGVCSTRDTRILYDHMGWSQFNLQNDCLCRGDFCNVNRTQSRSSQYRTVSYCCFLFPLIS